jgi:thiamine biosynthesis lipoprotein
VAELLAAGADGALLSVGGDLRAAGTPPEPGGWVVDVADPHDEARAVARVVVADGGVATSGTDVRRWRTRAGDAVHHVLDPATGRPAGAGRPIDVVAATVVAGTGAWADALAKAALVDWAGSAPLLDAVGAGACVVTADGRTSANECWARFAASPVGTVTA